MLPQEALDTNPPLAKWPVTQRAQLKERMHIKSHRRTQLAPPSTVAVWRFQVQRELLDFGFLSPWECKCKYPPHAIDDQGNHQNKHAKLGTCPWFSDKSDFSETAGPRWKLERALLSVNSIIRVLGEINKPRSLSEEATHDCYKASFGERPCRPAHDSHQARLDLLN